MLSHLSLKRIYDWVSKRSFIEILKYVLVSAGGYIYIVVFMYIFIDLLKINKSLSYFSIYLFAYLFDYLLTLRFIFQREHKNILLIKYVLYLAIFFILNNVFYNTMIFLNVHYMVSTITTTLILFPLRFLSFKFVIFIDS